MKRKNLTLYNVIFPLWIVMFLPPFILVVLFGNLLLDAAVILLGLRAAGWKIERPALVSYILKAWGLGFLADVAGAMLLLALTATNLAERWVEGYYLLSIWNSPAAVLFYLSVIAFSGAIIFWGNKYFCAEAGVPEDVARKVATLMGIITAPWAFLIPTTLFHRWF